MMIIASSTRGSWSWVAAPTTRPPGNPPSRSAQWHRPCWHHATYNLDARGVRHGISIRGEDRGATRTADRVSAQRCRHLHLWRRGWWREDGRTDLGAATPCRSGRQFYRRLLPAHDAANYQPRSALG